MKKGPSSKRRTIQTPAKQSPASVVCLQCGCLCDDIGLDIEAGAITSIAGACDRGRDWFVNGFSTSHASTESCVNGKPVSFEEAVRTASDILRASRFPLVLGLENATVETQRQAFDTVRLSKGVLAPGSSGHYRAMERAIFEAGGITATLGEIRNRADLLLVWNSDPVKTHPRYFERYAVDPSSRFLPRGRADRTIIVIESQDTSTSSQADQVIRILPSSDSFAARTLHMLVRGLQPDADRVLQATGVDLPTWESLAQRLVQARYGAILHDPSQGARARVEMEVRGLIELVTSLNDRTSFVFMPLGECHNPTGATEVVTWMGGVSGFVSFQDDTPKALDWVESEVDLLSRRMVDAVLFIGRHPMAESNPSVWQWLGHIPTIVLASEDSALVQSATVSFRTKTFGLSDSGTVFRSDGVSLPIRCLHASDAPSDEEVLRLVNTSLGSFPSLASGGP